MIPKTIFIKNVINFSFEKNTKIMEISFFVVWYLIQIVFNLLKNKSNQCCVDQLMSLLFNIVKNVKYTFWLNKITHK